MTQRERILATLSGKPVDALPYIPRLDIWYNANKRNGTLPHPYQNASLRDIADDLDFGYHAIVPNFNDFCMKDGDMDVGLGLYHLHNNPYRLILHNVERKLERRADGTLRAEYLTPKGKITTCVRHDEAMKRSGITLYVITEHAIKSYEDYPALAYILNNIEVIAHCDSFVRYREEFIGDRGVAVALSAMFACPMHYLIKELMAIDTFYYELYDYPDEMAEFAAQIQPFCDKLFEVALNSPSEIILSGANYDTSITAPDMFKGHITPQLKKQAELLHARGKFLATHTDGDNTGLLGQYVESCIDIADSICPAPMTKISLEDTRAEFKDRITIWGGIPSTSVLESIMSDYEFEKYIDNMFSNLGRGDHLILSVADTVPPAAEFSRLLHIAKKAKEFGPVKPA